MLKVGLRSGLVKITMNNGELYKLINDYIGHGILDGKDIPYPVYNKQSTIEVLNRFLNEAKSEYEAIHKEAYDKVNDARAKYGDVDWEFIEEIHQVEECKRHEWYIKWFGKMK
jgi:hypothetical protein